MESYNSDGFHDGLAALTNDIKGSSDYEAPLPDQFHINLFIKIVTALI